MGKLLNELINLRTSLAIFGGLIVSSVTNLSENVLNVGIWVVKDLINKLFFRVFFWVFDRNLRLSDGCSLDVMLQYHLSLETYNLCSSFVEVFLHGGHAVMRTSSIDMNSLFTCLAVDLLLATLLVTVEFHIFAKDS